ncbi:MAG TPA: glycosyltransferase family 4 protein [Candidatus Marinimicrobia bacterium]|nr:glycosyltransferase family 4 protein [Candidatus Neomarinimicrobiota bacterium]HRS51087.1 glycosyltransferase family 4 protein [Candidatus Neomarinimicrobiota bacterium]HRU92593.1 glycosyltransferase family 4 protein [Candidatus Neomarinimicrobiota bacterium]
MKFTFILPGFIKIPMGGVKVVNEYANRLAERGNEVTLVYPLTLRTGNWGYALRKKISALIDRIQRVSESLYYTPNPAVNVMVVRSATSKYIPNGDAIIAIGWQTAEAVAELPPEHGRKFYLLQSFETYFSQKKRILATYHLPLQKIAVASWIINEINQLGEKCFGPLGNAINPTEFFIENPQLERCNDVLMVYHPHKIKGAQEGLAALQIIKKRWPTLTATIVAPRKPVHRIPSWIKVIIRPPISDLRHLYNTSKIFLHSSRWEGWPLPPLEAMACGCAVVATANRGVQEYLVDQENALLCPINDVQALAQNVITLLESDQLREKLANSGLKTIQCYNWTECTSRLEQYLTEQKTE